MDIEKLVNEPVLLEIDNYESNFSVISHKVLGVINTFGLNIIYGITYLEIAQYSFLKYFHESFLEICDVSFLSPLVIEGEEMEVQTVVKKEIDSLRFIVSSKSNFGKMESNKGFLRYAKGIMYKIKGVPILKYRLAELKKGCDRPEQKTKPDFIAKINQTCEFFNIESLLSGTNEILLEVKVSEKFIKEYQGKVLNPSIYDLFLNIAIHCVVPGTFEPLFYKRLRLCGKIVDKFYIYLCKRVSPQNTNIISFDVFYFNELEEAFLTIEDYTVSYKSENNWSLHPEIKTDKTESTSSESNFTEAKYHSSNQNSIEKKIIRSISNLSWRQMNCMDRCATAVIGRAKSKFIDYFKLFLGALSGYSIKEFVIANFYNGRSPQIITVLNMFGFNIHPIKINNLIDIQGIISESIDAFGSLVGRFDEYYLFYSPHYLSGHTDHLTVITGYDKNKQRYSIIDSNHILENNGAERINYSKFFATFETIKSCFTNIPEEERFLFALDKFDDNKMITTEELDRILIRLLYYLKQNNQSGKDIEIIKGILEEKRELFDTDNIDSLYYILGGKELFFETLINYLITRNLNISSQKELSNMIIGLSNSLINNYLIAIYKGGELKRESMIESINDIQDLSIKFFENILTILETL